MCIKMLRTSTVCCELPPSKSTERVKIFPQKFFALKVGLGREELQGIFVFLYTLLLLLFTRGTVGRRLSCIVDDRGENIFLPIVFI